MAGNIDMTQTLSREVPIEPAHTALLFVDVQKYNCTWDGGEYAHLNAAEKEARYAYFFRTLQASALPNMVRLQQACRRGGIEVTYTIVESLTADGRDRSLDYKITGFHVPKGSADAKMVDELAPTADEIVFPKTSSSVFISTNIDYVLRNLGTKYLIIAGCLTDQCIDSAVRDACDLGYLVTVPTDACVTQSAERHDWALRNNRGYCRQVTTAALLAEIARLTEKPRLPETR
jgi:ureidoacrylate peracid hydrolase